MKFNWLMHNSYILCGTSFALLKYLCTHKQYFSTPMESNERECIFFVLSDSDI